MSPRLPRPHARPWTLDRSRELEVQARTLVPTGTHSMMKRPEQFCPGRFPVFLASGDGALVEDVDGNQYIDFISGLGASALGHRHPALMEAARKALEDGFVHSLPSETELAAAEALIDLVPHAEMARFFKTGADATSAAVRLARVITGRDDILTVGYNGWHDAFMYDTPGVPAAVAQHSRRMPLFTPADEAPLLDAVRSSEGKLAAVLLSVPYNRRLEQSFVRELRSACNDAGVLLVFDEIVTGFRLALAGAQEYFGVEPDLACYSKALAAGMPLSAVVGPAEHMQKMEGLQVSTTFGGERVSLAVCIEALAIYRSSGHIQHLQQLGEQLATGLRAVATELKVPLEVDGYLPLPFLRLGPTPPVHVARMTELQGRMAERGVLLRRDVNFICGAHDAGQIEHTIGAARTSLAEMKEEGFFADAETAP